MAGQRKPTTASAWSKGPKSIVTELPSGKVAKLRPKLNTRALYRVGDIPEDVAEVLMAATVGAITDVTKLLGPVADFVCERMFLEPKVYSGEREDQPQGHVHVDDIDDQDASFVVDMALGGAPDVAAFRGVGGGADAGDDGEGVGEEPE